MLTCKKCNATYAADFKFCPFCGAENDVVTCPSCHSAIPADSAFCPKCSNPTGNTEKCLACGGMNPKGARYCSTCGRVMKVKTEVYNDVDRIKAVIPFLREALEARAEEVKDVEPLTKKELKAKKKIEKIAKKAGFTLVDPDEEVEELTAEDLIAELPECECDCDCDCECEEDPFVTELKKQNANLEAVIAKLSEKAEPAPAPQVTYQPPMMPIYYPVPQAPAPQAPAAQPIIIQQPAPQAPATQPIIIQQPGQAQPVVIQQDGQVAPVAASTEKEDKKAAKKEAKKAKRAAKKAKRKEKGSIRNRFAALLMIICSAGFLAAMIMLPLITCPADVKVPSGLTGQQLGEAFMALEFIPGGAEMFAKPSELFLFYQTLSFTEGDFTALLLTIAQFGTSLLMILACAFTVLDVVFSLFRLLTGKARRRRGKLVRYAFLCYILVIVAFFFKATVFTSRGVMDEKIIAFFTSFINEGKDFIALGLGAVAGFGALLLRQIVNCFVKKQAK